MDEVPNEMLIKIASHILTITELVRFGSTSRKHNTVMVTVLRNHMLDIGKNPNTVELMIKTLRRVEKTYDNEFPAGVAKGIKSKYRSIQRRILQQAVGYRRFSRRIRLHILGNMIFRNFNTTTFRDQGPNLPRPGILQMTDTYQQYLATGLQLENRHMVSLEELITIIRAQIGQPGRIASIIWNLLDDADRETIATHL